MKSTQEIIARLRDRDNVHDGDVDEAADRLEELANKIERIRLIAVSGRSPQERIAHIISKIDDIIGG